MARIVGRSLADGGLRPDSSGGHFGWRGCPDFRHALAGEAYASSVPGNSYCGNAGESPGRQRSRRHFPCPNISVHLLPAGHDRAGRHRSEEHTSELQSLRHLVCRLLLEKKKKKQTRESHCTIPATSPRVLKVTLAR